MSRTELQNEVRSTQKRRRSAMHLLGDMHEGNGTTESTVKHYALMVHPHPERQQLIAEAAYHRAEARGFSPGHELDDWLAAEAEVDSRLYGEWAA